MSRWQTFINMMGLAFPVLTERENCLRAMRFQEPEWIPCRVLLSGAIWKRHRDALDELVLRHSPIFGSRERGKRSYDDFPPSSKGGEKFTDSWGCVWHNLADGIRGQVKGHPLADWKSLSGYHPPDPLTITELGTRIRWEEIRADVARARAQGRMVWGGGDRFFERLHFLRGFRNLMMDLHLNPPELRSLIEMVVDHNAKLISKWIEVGADCIAMGDDLGTQTRAMMSPNLFRKHLLPGYAKMCNMARQGGCEVYLHSDGHIMELMDDLMAAGFTVINPQVNCNGIRALAKKCKGRVCLDADIDRQQVLPRGSPAQVRKHVEDIVLNLGSKEGGLMMIAGVYGDVPLENIEALCQAMEDYSHQYG